MSNEVLFFQALSSAVALTGFGIRQLLNRYLLRKKRQSIFVVLVSRKSGTTSCLKNQVDEIKDKVVMVDALEDIVESQDEETRSHLKHLLDKNSDAFAVKAYPLVKNYLNDMSRIHRNRPIVLFTSDTNLVRFLKVPDKQVISLLPSIKLYSKSVSKMDEEESKLYAYSREKLLTTPYPKILFSSKQELSDIVQHKILGQR